MRKILRLKGKTAVFIDWANVHGWEKSLKKRVDIAKLLTHLKSYSEVKEVRFYFGTDNNLGSLNFIKRASKLGYMVTTKQVKHILVAELEGRKIYQRKCDFDIEICIDVHKALEKDFQSFVFFSGDGDFEPLYRLLVDNNKHVIVVYMYGHLGKEIWEMKRGVFKISIVKLGVDLSKKMTPGTLSRPRA